MVFDGPVRDLRKGAEQRQSRAGGPYDDVARLQTSWRASSARRDHEAALGHADRALALLGPRTRRGRAIRYRGRAAHGDLRRLRAREEIL
jgi:hypothetical protein